MKSPGRLECWRESETSPPVAHGETWTETFKRPRSESQGGRSRPVMPCIASMCPTASRLRTRHGENVPKVRDFAKDRVRPVADGAAGWHRRGSRRRAPRPPDSRLGQVRMCPKSEKPERTVSVNQRQVPQCSTVEIDCLVGDEFLTTESAPPHFCPEGRVRRVGRAVHFPHFGDQAGQTVNSPGRLECWRESETSPTVAHGGTT